MGLKKKYQWCLCPLTHPTPGQWSPHGKSRIPQDVVRSPTGALSGLLESRLSPPRSSKEANQSPAVSIETTGRALRRGLYLFPAMVYEQRSPGKPELPPLPLLDGITMYQCYPPGVKTYLGVLGFPTSSGSKEASSIRGGLLNRKFK